MAARSTTKTVAKAAVTNEVKAKMTGIPSPPFAQESAEAVLIQFKVARLEVARLKAKEIELVRERDSLAGDLTVAFIGTPKGEGEKGNHSRSSASEKAKNDPAVVKLQQKRDEVAYQLIHAEAVLDIEDRRSLFALIYGKAPKLTENGK